MTNTRGFAAAAATLGLAAALFIPFCGVLFDCGCGWPWQGNTRHCNIHNSSAPDHCPWCVHPMIAVSSFSVAGLAGALVAWKGEACPRAGRQTRTPAGDFLMRSLGGVGAFLVVAAIAGWLTALSTGYPMLERFLAR